MTPALATALALAGLWGQLQGEAAFSYRIDEAAETRGVALRDPGCALVDCDLLGRQVWVRVNGRWHGPFTSVDCGAERDLTFHEEHDRVIDLPWSVWQELGLPLAPVRVAVSLAPPGLLDGSAGWPVHD